VNDDLHGVTEGDEFWSEEEDSQMVLCQSHNSSLDLEQEQAVEENVVQDQDSEPQLGACEPRRMERRELLEMIVRKKKRKNPLLQYSYASKGADLHSYEH
jgi:hypothetical protein